jgi:hypothetical protein
MMKNNTLRRFAAGALSCSAILLTLSTSEGATFLGSDITNWIGPGAGPGISQSVLVIQWPSQPAWAWGYRWDNNTTRDGRDMLMALAGRDARFSFTGSGFISDLRWDANLDGTPEFTFPSFNATTGQYLNYFVNNNQQFGVFDNGAAPAGAHILPPPGSPYDETGPGAWISSNTGVLGRPVVDGSWDGWIYSDGSTVPALPVNAPSPIPEPGAPGLILAGAAAGLRRQRPFRCYAVPRAHSRGFVTPRS